MRPPRCRCDASGKWCRRCSFMSGHDRFCRRVSCRSGDRVFSAAQVHPADWTAADLSGPMLRSLTRMPLPCSAWIPSASARKTTVSAATASMSRASACTWTERQTRVVRCGPPACCGGLCSCSCCWAPQPTKQALLGLPSLQCGEGCSQCDKAGCRYCDTGYILVGKECKRYAGGWGGGRL